MNGTILLKALFDDLKIVEKPSVIRIAMLHINKALEVNNKIEKRAFLLKLLKVIIVKNSKGVIQLILIKEVSNILVLTLKR